mgnify:CR=1 FL=1
MGELFAFKLPGVMTRKISLKQTILIFPINKKHLVAKRLEYERKATGASQEYGIKVLYSDPKYNQGFKNIVTGKNIANEILRVITPGNLKAKSSPILSRSEQTS